MVNVDVVKRKVLAGAAVLVVAADGVHALTDAERQELANAGLDIDENGFAIPRLSAKAKHSLQSAAFNPYYLMDYIPFPAAQGIVSAALDVVLNGAEVGRIESLVRSAIGTEVFNEIRAELQRRAASLEQLWSDL